MKISKTITFIALTTFLPIAFAQASGTDSMSQGHKSGMMVAQIMGGGMMGGRNDDGQSSNNDQAASASVNPKHADALLAYIRENSLPCTSCHSVSGNGVGPSFATISANYAKREDSTATLENHIANGFGRMPGGLASKSKAAVLGKMILDLTKSE